MNSYPERDRARLLCGVLLALVLAAYWPVLRSQFIGLDDPQYVTENAQVLRGVTAEGIGWALVTGAAANWHPVTWWSHMLDCQLFGLNPVGHHATSLLLHLANVGLVFFVLRAFTGALWRSFLVAALFGLHPLHVESVAWVAERKDVLSTCFFLLTLWAYERYARTAEPVGKLAGGQPSPGGVSAQPPAAGGGSFRFRRRDFYLLALGLFALGLMSKPMLVTLPGVLLLFDFWPLARVEFPPPGPRLRGLLWEKLPFILLAAASSLITLLVQQHGRAVTAVLPLSARSANAVASYWKYLAKTAWPLDLAVFYPHPDIRYPISHQWPAWAIALAAAGLVAVSVWVWLRGKRAPWLAVGWFWYLGTLVPVIGLVQVGGQGMADRYTYIPLLGIFIAAVWGVNAAANGLSWARVPLAVVSTGLVVAGAALTQRQVGFWKTDFDLFNHALAVTTDNAVAEIEVGTGFRLRGDFDEAIRHYRAAIAAAPANVRGYDNLGLTFLLQGHLSEAVQAFNQAIAVAPWDAAAHNDLGLALWRLDRRSEAQAQVVEALRLQPDFPEARVALGTALLAQGNLEDAATQFSLALAARPGHGDALNHLGELRLKQGRLPEAAACFDRWVQASPQDPQARINFGGVLYRLGRAAEALTQYARAVELAPELPVARFNFATLLAAQSRLPAAAAQFAEAVRLQPDFLEAQTGLGRTLIGLGKFAEAVPPFAAAARLCPTNTDLQVFWGTALMLAGKTNEATGPFAAALRLEPNLARNLAQEAKALAAQSQFNTALARFNTALWIKPDDADTHEGLGQLLEQQGRADEAAAHLREAVRLRAASRR